MAFVVARHNGRFEVRESLHTANGPRARSLVGFDVLTGDVLKTAAQRAQRPFNVQDVIRSGRRAGARIHTDTAGAKRAPTSFLAASRRMANSLEQAPRQSERMNPGAALLELLGFADAVTASQPARPFESLGGWGDGAARDRGVARARQFSIRAPARSARAGEVDSNR